MLWLGQASPPPEVAASKVAALGSVVAHEREYVLIESVAPLGGRAQLELKAVAWIAELLHHEGLLDLGAYLQVAVYIVLRVSLGARQVLDERVLLGPAPVVGPQVDVGVVDVLVGRDALPAVEVVLAAPGALAADADQVVGVERADERRCLGEPFLEGRHGLTRECPRLVAYLPRHDGGVVLVGQARVAVGAAQYEAHVVVEQLVGLLVGGILGHGLHECGIADLVRAGLLALAGLLQVVAVAAAPLPRVVQVEHGHHPTLAHLLQQVVEAGQYGVVIHAGGLLQRGFHLGPDAALAVRAHEDAQVVDAHLLHQVELLREALAVAPLPFRAEDGAVPEVGANIIIRFAALDEVPVLHAHEVRCRRLLLLLLAGGEE